MNKSKWFSTTLATTAAAGLITGAALASSDNVLDGEAEADAMGDNGCSGSDGCSGKKDKDKDKDKSGDEDKDGKDKDSCSGW